MRLKGSCWYLPPNMTIYKRSGSLSKKNIKPDWLIIVSSFSLSRFWFFLMATLGRKFFLLTNFESFQLSILGSPLVPKRLRHKLACMSNWGQCLLKSTESKPCRDSAWSTVDPQDMLVKWFLRLKEYIPSYTPTQESKHVRIFFPLPAPLYILETSRNERRLSILGNKMNKKGYCPSQQLSQLIHPPFQKHCIFNPRFLSPLRLLATLNIRVLQHKALAWYTSSNKICLVCGGFVYPPRAPAPPGHRRSIMCTDHRGSKIWPFSPWLF